MFKIKKTPLLTIGKLAKLTGIHADTLRYYEKMWLIKTESRSRAGYRLYKPDTVGVIRFICGAKLLNFTLAEIRSMLALDISDQDGCAKALQVIENRSLATKENIKALEEIKVILLWLTKNTSEDTTSKNGSLLDYISGSTKESRYTPS